MDSYFIYLIIGAIGGLLVGLIGGGIGPIVIPTLIFILINAGVNQELAVHLAVGTSLSVVVVTTLITICGYRIGKLINWQLFKRLLPGTLLGALLGSSGSALLSGKILQDILGVFMILFALFTLGTKSQTADKKPPQLLPGNFRLILITAILSACSTVFGISDGIFLIPFLSRFNFSLRHTIATSTVCAFSASLTGTISYLLVGMNEANLPEHTFGYVYLPAFFAIILTSSLFSSVGVYLNKIVPEQKLKNIFAIFMMLVGTKILFI